MTHYAFNFAVNGTVYTVSKKASERRDVKSRVYIFSHGADDLSTANIEALAKRLGAPSMHTKRGEYPALDKAWDRHNRSIIEAQRRVLEAGFGALADDAKFSRRAGCGCGCSPGFILATDRGLDYFINAAAAE